MHDDCEDQETVSLTKVQKERYDRNIRVKGIGEAGQLRLLSSRVLVIGAGGLGSTALLYLAAAGIGSLTIADHDTVSMSNLQRQVLYVIADLGKSKALCAAERIHRLNPDICTVPIQEKITYRNLSGLLEEHDFIVECSDDADTKFLINDTCVRMKKPFSHCGVTGTAGQIMTYIPGHACMRCAFEKPDHGSVPTAEDIGILGAAAGTLGALQAGETIKYFTGCGRCLSDAFLFVDLATCTWKVKKVKQGRKCICR